MKLILMIIITQNVAMPSQADLIRVLNMIWFRFLLMHIFYYTQINA